MDNVHVKLERLVSFLMLSTGVILKSCSGTGWLNNFDQKFSHRVAAKHVVTGMASYHKNYYE